MSFALERQLRTGPRLPGAGRFGTLADMSNKSRAALHSKVTNGVIPLPRGAQIAEGAEVAIVPLDRCRRLPRVSTPAPPAVLPKTGINLCVPPRRRMGIAAVGRAGEPRSLRLCVILPTPQPGDGPFLRGMLKLAKPRRWPRDYALNHGHYTKGHPRK